MSWFKYPVGLSAESFIKRLEDELGLVGFARFLKVQEQLAAVGESCVTLSRAEWLVVLSAEQESMNQFFECSERLGLFQVEETATGLKVRTSDGRVVAESNPSRPVVDVFAIYTLFDLPQQWATWLIESAKFPRELVELPGADRVFRHWIASNVTVGELEAVLSVVKAESVAVESLGQLHELVASFRRCKLKEIKEC